MNKHIKQLLVIASIGLLYITQSCWAEPILNHATTRNYIENAIDQLLAVDNEYDPLAQEDISTIKERVVSSSLKPTLWERLSRRAVERTSDNIQNNVFAGIIDFVEEKSYQSALDKTNNAYISSKVSKNLRNFVSNRIAQTTEFKPGGLARFVGCRLRTAILEQTNRFSYIRDTTSMRIIKCQLCQEKILETECVTLSSCNHTFCKKCMHEYFFEKQNIARCPRCTKSIDIDQLKEKLYGTSALTENKNLLINTGKKHKKGKIYKNPKNSINK